MSWLIILETLLSLSFGLDTVASSQLLENQLQESVSTIILSVSSRTASATLSSITSLPTVNLGHAIHRASVSLSNQSNIYYNFSNIRYAAPPVGKLRWLAPSPVVLNRIIGIQDGTYGNICPQALAGWQTGSIVPTAANEDEDCLFLDVVVPRNVIERKNETILVPVIVWIHGGGYAIGSKIANGSPVGLLDQASDEQIWVGINYRLGAFGFLNGPLFANEATPNVGLYDQRAALRWVQDNIYLFGGDPNRVTVIGESAGASSILYQITAYGGMKAPFQSAILQSPAIVPIALENQSNAAYAKFLTATGVTNVKDLRKLNSTALQLANKQAQHTADYGLFTFAPAPDGSFIPDLAGKQLMAGAFDTTIKIMTAHNSNEAGHYTSPTANSTDDFITWLNIYFPAISTSKLTYITKELYPADYSGSYGYTTPFLRLDRAISEFTFDCYTLYIAHAYQNQTYNYLFSITPGNHTQDIPYSFYNGPISTVLNDTVAIEMQQYFTSFVQGGDPNRAGLEVWNAYGQNGTIRNFNLTKMDFVHETDLTKRRCAYWQVAMYGDDYK